MATLSFNFNYYPPSGFWGSRRMCLKCVRNCQTKAMTKDSKLPCGNLMNLKGLLRPIWWKTHVKNFFHEVRQIWTDYFNGQRPLLQADNACIVYDVKSSFMEIHQSNLTILVLYLHWHWSYALAAAIRNDK